MKGSTKFWRTISFILYAVYIRFLLINNWVYEGKDFTEPGGATPIGIIGSAAIIIYLIGSIIILHNSDKDYLFKTYYYDTNSFKILWYYDIYKIFSICNITAFIILKWNKIMDKIFYPEKILYFIASLFKRTTYFQPSERDEMLMDIGRASAGGLEGEVERLTKLYDEKYTD